MNAKEAAKEIKEISSQFYSGAYVTPKWNAFTKKLESIIQQAIDSALSEKEAEIETLKAENEHLKKLVEIGKDLVEERSTKNNIQAHQLAEAVKALDMAESWIMKTRCADLPQGWEDVLNEVSEALTRTQKPETKEGSHD